MLILPNLIDGHSLKISPTFGWYLFSSSEGRKNNSTPLPAKSCLVLFLDLQGNVRKPYKLSIFAEALFNNEPFL